MTYDQLCKAVLAVIPTATFGEDNDGQLLVYTGLREVTDQEELVEFEEPE